MQIISPAVTIMVGATSSTFPLPLVNPAYSQANYIAVQNIGPSDACVNFGTSPGVSASSSDQLVGAAVSSVQPATWRTTSALIAGPYLVAPFTQGWLFGAAVALPTLLMQADTTATAGSGSSTITVTSATGIQVGQTAMAPGIVSGATVTDVSGTTITLSTPTTDSLSSTEIQFAAAPIPTVPTILIVALGR